ncbi:MAG: hypothetical protein ACLRFL_00030 [Clostridia bacterium]
MINVSNEELKELSIYELRHLARDTGVKSPTSKVKEELIKQIIEIREGKREPIVERSKKGRPPKVYNFNKQKQKAITFCQDQSKYDLLGASTMLGYVDIFDNIAYFCVEDRLSSKYVINEELFSSFNLKIGDKILVEIDSDKNSIKDIYTINGQPSGTLDSRCDYYDFQHIYVDKKISFSENFGDLEANLGDNVFLFGANNINNTKMLINALNNVENCKKIYINTTLTEKTKGLILDLKDSDKFLANITDEFDYAKSVVALAINYAKRLFEMGENVLIAVDDILSISAIEDTEMLYTKALLSLSKTAQNSASISIFALMTRDEKLLWADKLADRRFVIDGEDFMLLR